MTPPDAWLRQRIGAAPPRLLEAMLNALPANEEMPLPEALAEGARSLYSAVIAGSGGREDALALLAADALFTHAFQAQAEIAHESLGAFAERWSGRGKLANLAV